LNDERKRALGAGHLSPRGLHEGDLDGVLNRYIKRDVKMPWKRVFHYIGAPVGNLEGIRLPALFERKE
jgi:hypothetical protein